MFKWIQANTALMCYALLACLICGALGASGGVWLGMRWAKGAQAIKRVVQQDIEMIALRDEHRTQLRELNQAAERLNLISEGFEHDKHSIDRALARTQAQLGVYLANRPDLAGCDFGPDGMRIYIEALRPAAAPAAYPREPDAGVSGATDAGGQRGAGVPAERDPGSRAVSPVRALEGAVEPSGSGKGAAGTRTLRQTDRNTGPRKEAAQVSMVDEGARS